MYPKKEHIKRQFPLLQDEYIQEMIQQISSFDFTKELGLNARIKRTYLKPESDTTNPDLIFE